MTIAAQSDPASPPLVGREREQAILSDALAAAMAGRGGLVLIGGEAGIGKTALAESLCAEAARQGALALAGHCYDLSETPPYGPWLELLSAAALPGLPALPESFVLTEMGVHLAQAASREALFGQFTQFFAAVAAARPLVLLLDDLHWADPASLDLLRALARRLPSLSLLLLVTYRSDELTRRHPLHALLPLLEREARAARLDLRRFAADDLRALLAARYALPAPDAARLVEWLHGRTEGNAFFATQLLRALEDEALLHRTSHGWSLGDLSAVGLPAALRQVLEARLARRGEEAQRLLALAAIIGQEVPLSLWAAVAETDEDGLLATIEAALQAHLLTETPDGTAVRFAHALIREALYEGTLALRRRRVHRLVGAILAEAPQSDLDAVADHFQRAGDPRAAAWLVRAGDRAQRAYAWVSASAKYEAALALMEQRDADPLLRARLLHTLAQVRRYTDRPRAIALLAEAAALAAEGGDPNLAAAARFDHGHMLCLTGDYGAGLTELRATLPVLEALPPDRLAALPTAIVLGVRPGEAHHRGVLLFFLTQAGYLAEAVASGADTLNLTPATSLRALFAAAFLHYSRGEPVLATQALAASIGVASVTGQHREVTIGLFYRGFVLATYAADDLAARAALTAEVMAALPAAREADPAVTADEILMALRLIEGSWADLARAMKEHPDRFLGEQSNLARLRGDAGARGPARVYLPDGPATPPGTRALTVGLWMQQSMSGLALDLGDLPEARAWLAAQDRWLAWSGAVWGRAEAQLGWAAYHRASGDSTQALEHATVALAHATAPRQPLALVAAHRLLGELATDARRFDDAAAHLAAALALADACAAPYERALTLLALADLRCAQGESPAARVLLDEARTLFVPLGARPALARVDALAAHLAAEPLPPAAYPAGLSAREAEVLRLVAQGLTNAQVAERLFLSPRTVDQHLRSIFNKLGVSSRSAATRFAIEHSLS